MIASAAPHSHCPFSPPRPFLLRLDAPPRPQPGGRADGRPVARPSGADSIILQHQRHLLGRPPARLSSRLIKFPSWRRSGSWAHPPTSPFPLPLPSWGGGGRDKGTT